MNYIQFFFNHSKTKNEEKNCRYEKCTCSEYQSTTTSIRIVNGFFFSSIVSPVHQICGPHFTL